VNPNLLWLVPALPAAGALLNGLRALRGREEARGHRLTSAIISNVATALTALVSTLLILFYVRSGQEQMVTNAIPWFAAGQEFSVSFGLRLDRLSATMLLIVTWVGALVHLFSVEYMRRERGYARYFSFLNLFMLAMLLLILADNYVLMFLGWEGVGLASYLLIGFFYDKRIAADAGRKAFLVNRIADVGFLLALFLIHRSFGSWRFDEIFSSTAVTGEGAVWVAALLLLAACGKSAQLPLHVWLPDAMTGPTPVSALMHAATMVTAGVYLIARSHPLFDAAPGVMSVTAVIGIVTALVGAAIALVQYDVKKVLAYSTISQLGMMFVALGLGAYTAAIFHLLTHAFFKAALFLSAGSVIHGCNGEQDIRRLGGLGVFLPVTRRTFLISAAALAGLPPLAGFFSKDEILTSALTRGVPGLAPWGPQLGLACWILGLTVSAMTAYYIFRLYFSLFAGDFRGEFISGVAESEPQHSAHSMIESETRLSPEFQYKGAAGRTSVHATRPHESSGGMLAVLGILAFFSAFIGLLGFPVRAFGLEGHSPFNDWLQPTLESAKGTEPSPGLIWLSMIASSAVALCGALLARRRYRSGIPVGSNQRSRFYRKAFEQKLYFDEFYRSSIVRWLYGTSAALAFIDRWIVDGVVRTVARVSVSILGYGSAAVDRFVIDAGVNAVAGGAEMGSTHLRRMQSGALQNYVLIMGAGLLLLAASYLVFS